MSIRSAVCSAALAAALVTIAAPAFAAWSHFPNVNTLVTSANSDQRESAALPDGEGGVIVAWSDRRAGNFDIYVQRLDAGGRPLWTVNGVALCTAIGDQTLPLIVTDRAGGAIVAWTDFRSGGTSDIYVQRVNSTGVTEWTANGLPVVTSAGNQQNVALAAAGTFGGCVLAWRDFRAGNWDIYAFRVDPFGSPAMIPNGVPVCVNASVQGPPAIASDPFSNSFITWEDERTDAGDIYGQVLSSSGNPLHTLNGIPLVALANEQSDPMVLPDGDSGVLAAWLDDRSSPTKNDVYAQRFNSSGVGLWAAGGVALYTNPSSQALLPTLVADGLGGGIVAWQDYRNSNADLFAQRFDLMGTVLWRPDGAPVCIAPSAQLSVRAVADGVGGVVVAWEDNRPAPASTDIYAQHLNFAGDQTYSPFGNALATSFRLQNEISLASDGALGAIACFTDIRSGVPDVYAQHVDQWGFLGGHPVIASVADVPGDQGGQVKVSWNASPLDVDPAFFNVSDYLLFRSAPPNLVESAIRRGAVTRSAQEAAAGSTKLLALPTAVSTIYWQYVSTHLVYHLAGYSTITPTLGDSAAGSNPRTLFMVMARSYFGQYWLSQPDSGYSADNLAPAPPAPFTGQYQGAVTRLHWNPNSEPDVAGYRLYRGSSAAFVPGPANFVASSPDTGYVDAIGSPYFYKLSAFDTHGNESGYSLVTPAGTTDVLPEFAGRLELAAPRPNPARGGANISYQLSRDGDVELAILDVSGRIVRQLASGRQTLAGHTVRWDGADSQGRSVQPGVYFVRLAVEGRVLTRRMAFVR